MMIFVTVGTQLPFPRLLKWVSDIAAKAKLSVIAQTCEPNVYPHIECHSHLDPAVFDKIASSSSLIVGHAGIGTILTAVRAEKPLVVVPRRAHLGEHRNEHQMDTVSSLIGRAGLYVCNDEPNLSELLLSKDLKPMSWDSHGRRDMLVSSLRSFIDA